MSAFPAGLRSAPKTILPCTSSSYAEDPQSRAVSAAPNPLSLFLDLPRAMPATVSTGRSPASTTAAPGSAFFNSLPHQVLSFPGGLEASPGSNGGTFPRIEHIGSGGSGGASPRTHQQQRRVQGSAGAGALTHQSRRNTGPQALQNFCTEESSANLLTYQGRRPGPGVLTQRCVHFMFTPWSAFAVQGVFIAVAVASSWFPWTALWLPHLLWAVGSVVSLVLRWNHQRKYNRAVLEQLPLVVSGLCEPKAAGLSSDP
eukprot:RCo036868